MTDTDNHFHEHSEEHSTEDHAYVHWDFPQFYKGSTPFIPKIFDGEDLDQASPEFNAVKITIDGRVKSELNWSEQHQLAKKCVERGLLIFWEMNLGLFSELKMPLRNQNQYLSLTLSLDHFLQGLWKDFKDHTLGLCLYRGNINLANDFKWNEEHHEALKEWLKKGFKDSSALSEEMNFDFTKIEEITPEILLSTQQGEHLLHLYCLNVAVDYLELLCLNMPDRLSLFLLIDAFPVTRYDYLAQLLTKERFSRFHLALQNCKIPLHELAWENDDPSAGYISRKTQKIDNFSDISIGVVLPSMDLISSKYYLGLREAFDLLLIKKIPFRIIPEEFLTTEWQGLDILLISSDGLSFQGKRKLQGFCAAGGQLVILGTNPLHISGEMSFSAWKKTLC